MLKTRLLWLWYCLTSHWYTHGCNHYDVETNVDCRRMDGHPGPCVTFEDREFYPYETLP